MANLRTIDGASQTFRATTSALPTNLAALVPDYLAVAPTGPSPLTTAYEVNAAGRGTVTLTAANMFGSTATPAATYTLDGLITLGW